MSTITRDPTSTVWLENGSFPSGAVRMTRSPARDQAGHRDGDAWPGCTQRNRHRPGEDADAGDRLSAQFELRDCRAGGGVLGRGGGGDGAGVRCLEFRAAGC